MKKIKIYMVDDHKMIVDGVSQILEKNSNFEFIGFALNGKDAINNSKLVGHIDVFIIDINLPDMDGFVVINSLKYNFPDSKFLILSMHNNKNIIKNAFNLGVLGYVLKNSGEEELVSAILNIYEGKKYISKEVMQSLVGGITDIDDILEQPLLTERETSVAKLTAQGMTSNEIADILFISPRTVETHRRNVMHKLNLKNTAELIKYAVQIGWITFD
ncbi:response regulator transcription factor [Candidatus Kapaibacterium sp.]